MSANPPPIPPPDPVSRPGRPRNPVKMAAAGLAGLALGVVASGGRHTLVKLMALGGAAYAGKRLFRSPQPSFDSPADLWPDNGNDSLEPLLNPPGLAPAPGQQEPQQFKSLAKTEVPPPVPAIPVMHTTPSVGSSGDPAPPASAPASGQDEPAPSDLSQVILALRGSIHARETVRLTRPSPFSPPPLDNPKTESPSDSSPFPSEPAQPTPFAPAATAAHLSPPAVAEKETLLDPPPQDALVEPLAEDPSPIKHPPTGIRPESQDQARTGASWLDLPPPSSLDRSSSLRQLASAAAQLRSTATSTQPRTPPASISPDPPPQEAVGFDGEEDEGSVIVLSDEDEAEEPSSDSERSPFTTAPEPFHSARESGDRSSPLHPRQQTRLPPPRGGPSPFRPVPAGEGPRSSDPSSLAARSPFAISKPAPSRAADDQPPAAAPAPSRPDSQKAATTSFPRTFWPGRIIAIAAVLIAGGLALYALNLLKSGPNSVAPNPEPGLISPGPSLAPPENRLPGLTGPGESSDAGNGGAAAPSLPLSAGDALQRFVDAASAEERTLYCLPTPDLAERMRLYPDQSPVGTAIAGFRLLSTATAAETNRQRLAFELRLRESSRVFPAFVQNTSEGFGVDWQACIQFKDSLLRRFCEGSFDLWNDFYVVLQRGHNYEDESANETRHWFILSSPGSPGFDQRVFVERDSELGRDLDQRFEFQKEYQVVAVLDRSTPDGAQPFMRLSGIARFRWEL